jgi:uncharacterized protein (TIGR02145 family)
MIYKISYLFIGLVLLACVEQENMVFDNPQDPNKDPVVSNPQDSSKEDVVQSFEVGKYRDSRDNRVYKTVVIGTQTWMAENLAYLPQVDASADGSEDVAGKYYYVYGYIPTGANETQQIANAKLESKYQTDGVLYNWNAAMDGVCPSGWHLPSAAEWTILNDYVDANNGAYKIGNSLKATTGWISSGNGTDQFGFSALPAGHRSSAGDFLSRGNYGVWCSASEASSTNACYRYLSGNDGDFYQSYSSKSNGFNVRCLEDTP